MDLHQSMPPINSERKLGSAMDTDDEVRRRVWAHLVMQGECLPEMMCTC